jgi:hypothetical protein
LISGILYASYLSDIWAISLDTRAVTRVAPAEVSNASQVTSLGGDYYFIDGRHDTGGTLYRFRPGQAATPIQTEPSSLNVVFLLPDATRNKLYWIASTIGPLIEFDVGANRVTHLTVKQTSNGIPASDESYLYWARNSLNEPPAIMRLRKP